MTGIDLTEAIHAAEASDAVFRAPTIRAAIIAAVEAAAPLIEARVRERFAGEIEAYLASPDGPGRIVRGES